jgi:hypothetical protein
VSREFDTEVTSSIPTSASPGRAPTAPPMPG